jgi:mono/diheme cytochrome c family protein
VAGHHILEAAMRRIYTLAVLLIFLLPAAVLFSQTASSESCSDPASIAKMVNPVKPNAESLMQGKKYYGYDCAMCHGQNGNGKGDVDSGEKLPDFTNPGSLKDKSDGELFCSLKNGKGHMPLERIRISPNELWNLINYVRSLAK